jgi:hypothetical protein
MKLLKEVGLFLKEMRRYFRYRRAAYREDKWKKEEEARKASGSEMKD